MNHNPEILNYSPPPPRRSPVPIIGAIACVVAFLCGAAIDGFGIWWIRMDTEHGTARGAAICATGILIMGLCVKWYRGARRAIA
jgi:hypothetical protein